MCSETLSKRVYWVDVAKLLAVVAVIMDHTYGILYSNERVAYASYYSVSLFILMMGVTSYWSYSKNDKGVSEKIKKNVGKSLHLIWWQHLYIAYLRINILTLQFT